MAAIYTAGRPYGKVLVGFGVAKSALPLACAGVVKLRNVIVTRINNNTGFMMLSSS